MTKENKKYNCICEDCGKDTFTDGKDYYMVSHKLWEQFGVGDKMLCIKCFETRLGRKLKKEDLIDCYLNNSLNYYTKQLLKN